MSLTLPRRALLVPVVLALAAAALVQGGSIHRAAATAPGPAASVPASGAYLGAAAWNPADNSGITALESQVGRTLSLHRVYSMWDTAQPAAAVRADVAAGRLPLVSIRPQLSSGTKLPWASIANGHRDATIRAQARGLASLHKPVLLAFHHEADLQSGYGSAHMFVLAFRHYAAVVRAAGATNVSMVVVLSAARYAGSSIADWYPGNDVVDWVGADAYNFAACSPGRPAWRTLAQAAGGFYRWGAATGKPLLLAEWGSAEDPHHPGAKAQWITDAGTTMRSWTRLKAASYFDQPGSCNWRLDSSSSALSAFRTLAHSSWAR